MARMLGRVHPGTWARCGCCLSGYDARTMKRREQVAVRRDIEVQRAGR